jgi:CDP-diacylglycerol--serine O-phosphatidyltransferase
VFLAGRRTRRRTESGITIIVADPGAGGPGAHRADARTVAGGNRRRRGVDRVAGEVPGPHSPDPAELARLTGMPSVAPVSPAVQAPAGGAPAGPLSVPLLPGARSVARRTRFALVNACTISSLALGVCAIFLAVNHVDLRWPALCLIACVVFDGLDGALARRLGVASPFGAQMDSLADMCSFGIAAPVVVYVWLAESASPIVVVPACVLVAVCAAIRLARFNVSPKDGRFFCGVPTTLAAAVLALGTLIAPVMPAGLRVAGVAVLALAMVSSFPYVKLARLLRLPPWLLVLPVVGALLDYRLTFAGAVLAYLLSGPVVWLRQRQHVPA